MKLLILTQKVDINDDLLGFFYGWIAEFAKHCEQVTVICLYQGKYDLPGNVKVLSLGKERAEKLANGYIIKLLYGWRFYKYIWQERRNYSKVFVHMNPEYAILGGLFWKTFGKKIGLWYTHKSVNFKLRLAEKLVDIIFTASKESFRLRSKKVKIVGHGIGAMKCKMQNAKCKINEKFKVITVGRISQIKDYETLIGAVEILVKDGVSLRVDIVGGPGMPEDEKYLNSLRKMVADKKLNEVIRFVGAVPNKNIAQYLNSADLFAHMSRTGSLDKTILEAMACGLMVLSCNDASKDLLSNYCNKLFYKLGDEKELAGKIKNIIDLSNKEKENISNYFKKIVAREHDLGNLIKKILKLNNGKTSR